MMFITGGFGILKVSWIIFSISRSGGGVEANVFERRLCFVLLLC